MTMTEDIIISYEHSSIKLRLYYNFYKLDLLRMEENNRVTFLSHMIPRRSKKKSDMID